MQTPKKVAGFIDNVFIFIGVGRTESAVKPVSSRHPRMHTCSALSSGSQKPPGRAYPLAQIAVAFYAQHTVFSVFADAYNPPAEAVLLYRVKPQTAQCHLRPSIYAISGNAQKRRFFIEAKTENNPKPRSAKIVKVADRF